jgi:hypothetical protein
MLGYNNRPKGARQNRPTRRSTKSQPIAVSRKAALSRATWTLQHTTASSNVRRPNEKGRVESGAGYVKKNFLNGLQLPPGLNG